MRRRAAHPRRWEGGLIAVILISAWLYGLLTTRSAVSPLAPDVLPGAQRVEQRGDLYLAYDAHDQVLGYAAAADATGYGGPVYLLVGVNPAGVIQGVEVIEQRETPGFYTLLRDNDYFDQFLGQDARQSFTLGQNVDGVSGATLSSQAVAQAIQQAAQKVQSGAIQPQTEPIRFGLPEAILLALLFGGALLPHIASTRFQRALRWLMLLVGLAALGFWLNQPLTLANYASLLSGYWPDVREHLYWYLLVFGVSGYALLAGKNLYCYTFCPFGAAQECLGRLANAAPLHPSGSAQRFHWLPRWLTVTALALGLAFRMPGAASYEPFGVLFSFSAGLFPWMLLVFVLFASMFILRPFCTYLCPVGVILNGLLSFRRQVKQQWLNRTRPKQA